MYRAIPGIALLSVALIAGCGSGSSGNGAADPGEQTAATTGAGSASTGPAAEVNAMSSYENQLADCMKQQGFTYIPRPVAAPVKTGADESGNFGLASFLQPDSELRKWRQKNGFGNTARRQQPRDMSAAIRARGGYTGKDPNAAVVKALDPAQRSAYNKALIGDSKGILYDLKQGKSSAREKAYNNSCQGKLEATRQAALKSRDSSPEARATKAADRRVAARYQSDQAVKAAGAKYANCLKERGYRLNTSDPLDLMSRLEDSVTGQDDTRLSSAQAKKNLPKEIKASLDDLDCRAPFADIMRTNYPTILTGEVAVQGGVS